MAYIERPGFFNILRGDERYNPRVSKYAARAWDGAYVVEGLMKPDRPKGTEAKPKLPDLPFRFIIPCDGLGPWQWQNINAAIFQYIQNGESLMDLDFTSFAVKPEPIRIQPGVNWGHIAWAALGIVAIGLVATRGN